MEFVYDDRMRTNRSKVVHFIFKGMTLTQMAMELGVTRSCVSYHVKRIYKKYNAKSRSEFILNTFNQIVDRYKNLLNSQDIQIEELNKENNEIRIILSGLLFSKNNPENFYCWELKAKKFL